MNIAHITKWVEALESGEYQQGKYGLRRDNRYCCLGVACEISREDLGLKWETQGTSDYNDILLETAQLPDSVVEWLGLANNENDPLVIYRGAPDKLSEINDRGIPFSEIATLIRKTFLQ